MQDKTDLSISILPNYTPEMVSLVLSGASELIECLVDGLSELTGNDAQSNEAVLSVCRTLRDMASEVC